MGRLHDVGIIDDAEHDLVLPTGVARANLTKILAEFRARGAAAAPVLFGTHRKPEAAIVPYDLIRLLDPIIEDLVIAARTNERIGAADGERVSHDDVADMMGWTAPTSRQRSKAASA